MRRVLKIIMTLALLISISLLAGCKSKDSGNNLENEIKDINEINLEELSKYKGTDIEDSESIENILDKLLANIYVRKFNYENKYGEYILNIKYSLGGKWNTEEKEKDSFMNYNSIILFSLINNLSVINYTLGDFDDTIYQFKKSVYENSYNIDLNQLPDNIEKWKTILDEENRN